MRQMLDLDLIEAPYFSWSKLSWLGLAMLAIGFLTLTYTWQVYQKKQVEYADLQVDLSRLNQQSQQYLQPTPVIQLADSVSPEKIKELQDAVTLLSAPWNEFFLAIEQADNKDIALLGLEPNSQKQQVLITGQAKNLQVALDYIQQLEAQPKLKQVFLQKHTIDEANQFKPVSFTIFASWEMAE